MKMNKSNSEEGLIMVKGAVMRHRFGRTSSSDPKWLCICPECGARVPHKHGKPCFIHLCPKCGARMIHE